VLSFPLWHEKKHIFMDADVLFSYTQRFISLDPYLGLYEGWFDIEFMVQDMIVWHQHSMKNIL